MRQAERRNEFRAAFARMPLWSVWDTQKVLPIVGDEPLKVGYSEAPAGDGASVCETATSGRIISHGIRRVR